MSQSAVETPTILVARTGFGLGLPLPKPATMLAAGCDLHAAIEHPVVLRPGERAYIPVGLRVALPPGWEAQVRPRSGLARRHGVTVLNAPGTIDADFRGEIGAILINQGNTIFEIAHGDRVAQLVVARVAVPSLKELDEAAFLAETATERGEGGFGSTGMAAR